MMGIVLVTIDVSVVNVAAPALGMSFHVGVSGLEWVLNVYTLAYACFLLNAGALSDRHGTRATFTAGFAIFTVASLVCGLTPSFGWLLAARIVQGLGAALLVPSALALLQVAFPEARARVRAIGWWAGAGSFALAGGPILGGALVAAFGWRSMFLINLPGGLLGLWLTRVYAPRAISAPTEHTDVAGQIFAASAVGLLAASMTQAGNLGWGNIWVICGFGGAGLTSAAFVAVELRSAHPITPPGIFRHRVFSTAVAIGFAINFAFYGLIFVLSLFFQRAQGLTALQTGLAFVPLTAVLLAVNLGAGQLNAWLGQRGTLGAGLGLAALGYLALLPTTASSQLISLAPAVLMIGAGVAMATPAMMTAALKSVDVARSGIGSGVVNAARQVGGALGVAVFGSLVAKGADFMSGFRQVMILAGGALVAACFAACIAAPGQQSPAA